MTSRRKTLRFLLFYLMSILAFGLLYYGYWLFNMDSFMINEQFNARHFDADAEMYDKPGNLEDYRRQADSMKMLRKNTMDTLVIEQQKANSLKPIVVDLRKKHEDAQWKNVEVWKKKQVPDSLRNKLAAMDYGLETLKENTSNGSMIANMKMEKTRIELEIAKIEVRSSDYILSHLTLFQDSVLTRKMLAADSIYYGLMHHRIPDLNTGLSSIQYELGAIGYTVQTDVYRELNLLDFLLFSAANASTVTYGDITPNNRWMRFALFCQAVSCIILIAFLTENMLSDKNNGSGTTTP